MCLSCCYVLAVYRVAKGLHYLANFLADQANLLAIEHVNKSLKKIEEEK